jgi:hypothetical protein
MERIPGRKESNKFVVGGRLAQTVEPCSGEAGAEELVQTNMYVAKSRATANSKGRRHGLLNRKFST